MVTRRVATSNAPRLGHLSWPVFEAVGPRDGPRLCLIAGVHGCEYPAIAAVVKFMRRLDASSLSGSIVAVPIGLQNALRAVGMLPGDPDPPPPRQRLVERFVWLRSATGGWWQADIGAGDDVAAGDRLGAVLDPFGDELETITAPEPGVVLFLTTSPAVAQDGLLLGLGGGMQPYP